MRKRYLPVYVRVRSSRYLRVYIFADFIVKTNIFIFFFFDFARFLRKKVSLIIRTYADLAENGYFARKK